jgi:DNA-directed RNA polymerase specialized sigma24 family protein
VRESVGELPTRCRSLIEMLYFDARNLSYEEIAEHIGMPVASIGPTRARCLERLRKIVRRRGLK